MTGAQRFLVSAMSICGSSGAYNNDLDSPDCIQLHWILQAFARSLRYSVDYMVYRETKLP